MFTNTIQSLPILALVLDRRMYAQLICATPLDARRFRKLKELIARSRILFALGHLNVGAAHTCSSGFTAALLKVLRWLITIEKDGRLF